MFGLSKLMRSDFNQPLNLGQDRMVTINELADMIASIAGITIRKVHVPGPQGVRGRNSDNSRLRQVLGWEPAIRWRRTGRAPTPGLSSRRAWLPACRSPRLSPVVPVVEKSVCQIFAPQSRQCSIAARSALHGHPAREHGGLKTGNPCPGLDDPVPVATVPGLSKILLADRGRPSDALQNTRALPHHCNRFHLSTRPGGTPPPSSTHPKLLVGTIARGATRAIGLG